MRIVDLRPEMSGAARQCAELLVEAFRELAPQAWPDLEAARAEVRQALEPHKVNRVMLEQDVVLGWAGAMPHYGGKVWEVHPVAIRPGRQGRGIGRLLLQDLERLAATVGVQTLWVGSDDETGRTTLSGVDLYQDVPAAIASVRNLRRHPYEFYVRCGFSIVGVLPDANGPGKPDIFLAKRVAGHSST